MKETKNKIISSRVNTPFKDSWEEMCSILDIKSSEALREAMELYMKDMNEIINKLIK